MNDGHLEAEKRRMAGRNVWTVCENDLEEWAKVWLDPTELETLNTSANRAEQPPGHSRVFVNDREHSRTFTNERERTEPNETEHIEHDEHSGFSSPPLELYVEMLDRLQRAERRAIELELQLRQSQRLLTENAESIVEREARVRESEAREIEAERKLAEKESAQRAEIDRLAEELDTLRTQQAPPIKRGGFFSWLGLRRKNTSSTEQSA